METDTPTQEAPVTQETTTTEASQEITWENSPIAQVYNPDGTPKAEAATALAEMGKEDLTGYALRNGQDFFTALKTGKDAAKFAGQKLDGVIKMPGEDATDDERIQFNKSLGALESAEDYAANIWPDELPEGFQKDEGLAGLLAEHAAKSPVMTADSVKELASKFIAHQQEQQSSMMEQHQQDAETKAKEVADKLTVELGGSLKYKEFSDGMKDMVTSPEFAEMGFQFQRNEDGTVSSENPLHAAMLSDPAVLRFMKERMDASKPANIPGQTPSNFSSETNEEKAQELYRKHGVGGFKSSKHLNEYNRLRGIS